MREPHDPRAGAAPSMRGRAGLLCLPAAAWLLAFVFVPLVLIGAVSFLSRGDYGEVRLPFTIGNYARLAGWSELGFDPLYLRVLARTLLLACVITAATIAVAVPVAFQIAALPPRSRGIALALVVIPFWTNLLIRTYAWQILLAAGGPLSQAAAMLGWIPPATGLQPGWFAVALAAFCDFLPFMLLPVYACVERVDWSLAEAAADLGATPARAFLHGVLPQIRPGIQAGAVLVFLPVTGQFVIPDLLGGGHTTLLGNLIQQQFGPSRDWPFGAAAATLTLVMLAVVLALRGRAGIEREEVRL